VKAPEFSAHCHNHFYPEEADTNTTYEQLDLLTLSGAFAFWLIMFVTAIVRELCGENRTHYNFCMSRFRSF
jgi:hypothetical protein